ncbi:MAG: hypothetical protein ACR2OZ_11185 [Verrucomicrobiales bacterium]
MIESILQARLRPVIDRRQRVRWWFSLAVCWAIAAAIGGLVLLFERDDASSAAWVRPALVIASLIAAGLLWLRHVITSPNQRVLAREIEKKHRDLDGRLLTAVQQEPNRKGDYNFLQQRLFEDALQHSIDHDWSEINPRTQLTAARVGQWVALAAFLVVLWHLPPPSASVAGLPEATVVTSPAVIVTPGDASIERGSSLVVMARFEAALPSSADLVIGETTETERRTPMIKSLADPIFGASVPEVSEGLTYRVDYAESRTRDFKVTVFEFPRLERADATLTYPEYTGLAVKRIEDCRRVSAVEGTLLDLALQLNKAVASAVLVPKDGKSTPLTLAIDPSKAQALLEKFQLVSSQSYDLQLSDPEGRANKMPASFILEVLPNRVPELKLTSPRGDQRPSLIEEIAFEGTAWDDFALLAYGLSFSLPGREPRVIELGRNVAGQEKHAFRQMLRLEDWGVQADQLVAWHVWAEDMGPDGRPRRTQGELFFGEVRPFEEIFRQGTGMEGEQQSEQSGQQGGDPASKLAELQKQIVNATWKLQRAAGTEPTSEYEKDATVVRDSQAQALGQAKAAAEKVGSPQTAGLWQNAVAEMERALSSLEGALTSPAPLPESLAREQSAYQALLKLRAREHQVARSKSRSGGQQSQSEQQRQEQLGELDLTESENRYETQREAQAPADAERREQMQVLNRLQELARRQGDVNERLNELQSALQEAGTEKEREELLRQLKRLEEEERQMLADMDELRQRMERAENQAALARERQQLDSARQDVQRAADSAAQGQASQAMAAGTRAQRQLQEMRDELRKRGSGQFADALREMRSEARGLATKQQEISRQVDELDSPNRKTLSDAPERGAAIDELAKQKDRTTKLIERASQLSQEAETPEPLLSRQLYDTVRRFSQEDAGSVRKIQQEMIRQGRLTQRLYDQMEELRGRPEAGKALELASHMLRQDLTAQAAQAEEQASAGIDGLKQGVEQAAESVLGDDTAALKLANQALENLTRQVEEEIAQAETGNSAAKNVDATPSAGAPKRDEAPRPPSQAQTGPASAEPASGEETGGTSAENLASNRQRDEGPAPPGEKQATATESTDGRAPRGQTAQSTNGRTPRGRAGNGPQDIGGRGGVSAPLTGEGFAPWSDGLRDIEEMIEFPDLRNDVAAVRERARVMRLELKRELPKPDWTVVRLEILKPLVEVRKRIGEELARRQSNDALVPIDRDPVPGRYSELVRRYYESLSK